MKKHQIMQAHDERGEEIEYQPIDGSKHNWHDCVRTPLWNWEKNIYRVKQREPIKVTIVYEGNNNFNIEAHSIINLELLKERCPLDFIEVQDD